MSGRVRRYRDALAALVGARDRGAPRDEVSDLAGEVHDAEIELTRAERQEIPELAAFDRQRDAWWIEQSGPMWWARTWGRYVDLTRAFARTKPRRARLERALAHLSRAVRRDLARHEAERARVGS